MEETDALVVVIVILVSAVGWWRWLVVAVVVVEVVVMVERMPGETAPRDHSGAAVAVQSQYRTRHPVCGPPRQHPITTRPTGLARNAQPLPRPPRWLVASSLPA